jgi:hypothetical protein
VGQQQSDRAEDLQIGSVRRRAGDHAFLDKYVGVV